MTDEHESTNPGIIVAAERAILKFLRDREANEAVPEDRGTSTVNQLAEHPVPANSVKQTKTVEELAAMIHQDLSQIEGCPKQDVKVTIYGLNPWNCLLTFGVDAGPVRNRAELQGFCDIITERLKRLYDVRDPHVEGSANGKYASQSPKPRGHNGFGLRGAARHDDHRLRGDPPGVTALCRQSAPHTPQLRNLAR